MAYYTTNWLITENIAVMNITTFISNVFWWYTSFAYGKTNMSLCNVIPVLFISLATTGFYLQKVNKLCRITKNGHFYWLKVLMYHSVQRLTALSQNCFPYSSSCIIIYHHVMVLSWKMIGNTCQRCCLHFTRTE